MALDEVERKSERPSERANDKLESATREVDSGRSELLRQQRQEMDRLRAGGSSGLSGDFGKLIISGLQAVGDAVRGRRPEADSAGARPEARPDGRGDTTAESRRTESDVARTAPESATASTDAPTTRVEMTPRPGTISGMFGRLIIDGLQAASGSFRRMARPEGPATAPEARADATRAEASVAEAVARPVEAARETVSPEQVGRLLAGLETASGQFVRPTEELPSALDRDPADRLNSALDLLRDERAQDLISDADLGRRISGSIDNYFDWVRRAPSSPEGLSDVSTAMVRIANEIETLPEAMQNEVMEGISNPLDRRMIDEVRQAVRAERDLGDASLVTDAIQPASHLDLISEIRTGRIGQLDELRRSGTLGDSEFVDRLSDIDLAHGRDMAQVFNRMLEVQTGLGGALSDQQMADHTLAARRMVEHLHDLPDANSRAIIEQINDPVMRGVLGASLDALASSPGRTISEVDTGIPDLLTEGMSPPGRTISEVDSDIPDPLTEDMSPRGRTISEFDTDIADPLTADTAPRGRTISEVAIDHSDPLTMDAPEVTHRGGGGGGGGGDHTTDSAGDRSGDAGRRAETGDRATTPLARAPFEFPGEDIHRDVEPGRHTVARGETVESIARAHLGEGASEADVAAYTREINHVNGYDRRGRHLREGAELELPGHTADGGFVTADASGNREVVWANGTVREENADGTGCVRRTAADGSLSEHHWGPRPEHNFELSRSADGTYRVADAGGEPAEVADASADVRIQRARMEELLDSSYHGPSDATARMRDDMREFEERARESGMPPEEVARTYAEVARVLETPAVDPLTVADSQAVAEQILHNAAHPEEIDQGNHETCGATSTESRMYSRHPSDAAHVVADVITTGHVTTHDDPPRTIAIDSESLRPRSEELLNPPSDGERSQASQLFQLAYVSTALDGRTTPPGSLTFEQRDPDESTVPHNETGEWVVDHSTTPPTRTPFDALYARELQTTEERLTGRHEDRPHVIINSAEDNAMGSAHFSSEEGLRNRLTEAREHGEMPLVMWVDSGNEPFMTDSGGGDAGGSGGGHFVTVTDFDPASGMVSLDNQWGDEHDHRLSADGTDHRVSLHDLYEASYTHPAPAADATVADAGSGGAGGETGHGRDRAGSGRSEGDGERERHREPGDRHGDGADTRLGAPPPFPGEVIRRHVEPELHTALVGETTESIAREHLGEGATDEDVRRHVSEIERINHLTRGQEITGRSLVLPGHSSDGAIVVPETRPDWLGRPELTGRETVTWESGSFREQRRSIAPTGDGSGDTAEFPPGPGEGFSRHFDAAGGYSDHHWGGRPEDNYDLTRTADGRYMVTEPGETTAVDRTDADDPRVHRAQWDETGAAEAVSSAHDDLGHVLDRPGVDALMSDREESSFRRGMEDFERRAREDGVAPDEVARTYEQVTRLLDDPTAEHVELARQIMSQAAYPTSINQGMHNTCGVTTVEAQTYMRHPAAAAELVADVSLTGSYRTSDGHLVHVTPDMIERGEEGGEVRPGERSYASEIFQVTLVNAHYQRIDPDFRYEQHVPESGRTPPDTGEGVYDYSSGTPRLLTESLGDGTEDWLTSPGMSDDELVGAAGLIRGNGDDHVFLSAEDRIERGHSERSEAIESEGDLRETLSRLRREGRLPATVAVYSTNEPFFTESGGGIAGGSGGAHVVTVTDYDDATGHVSIDNQWGADVDHEGSRAMDAGELYRAMRVPGSDDVITHLEHEEEETHRDTTELELLRQRHLRGDMDDTEYRHQLGDMLNEDITRSPGFEYNTDLQTRYALMLVSMSPDEREDVYSRIRDSRTRTRMRDSVEQMTEAIHAEMGTDGGTASTAADASDDAGAPSAAVPAHFGEHFLDSVRDGGGGGGGGRGRPETDDTVPAAAADTTARPARRGGGGHPTSLDGGTGDASTIDAGAPDSSAGDGGPAVAGAGDASAADAGSGADSGTGDRPAIAARPGFVFPGEVIHRDVDPTTHTVAAGETVESIARARLGAGATDQEVAAYSREISLTNGVDLGAGGLTGITELTLPGHTADGGYVRGDANGNRETVWADGVVREDHADGTGCVRRPAADGGTTEHHWGPRPEDHYELARTADGHFRVADEGHEPAAVADEASDVRIQRAHLEELMSSDHWGPCESTARMREDMREFEERARESGMPPEEVARTYAEVARVLETPPVDPLTATDSQAIAEQILHNAAHPEEIDQGNHETCGATSTESRMYTLHPSDAARVVADVATTGRVVTHDDPPRTLTIDRESLVPREEEQANPPDDGERSQASQLFQLAYVATALDGRTDPPGSLTFEQRDPDESTVPPNPTGEWIVDHSTDPPTRTPFDSLYTDELQHTEERLTGRHEDRSHVIINSAEESGDPGDHFTTEEDLTRTLTTAREHGDMPVVMWVDSANEPFMTDSGGGEAGGSGAGHFVTITDYDPATGRVSLDNQWGDEFDHSVAADGTDRRMTVHDLYRASLPRDELLRRDVEWNRDHHTVDGRAELELLICQRTSNSITEAQFDQSVATALREDRHRWATSGETYPGERARTEARYNQILEAVRRRDAHRAEDIERGADAEA